MMLGGWWKPRRSNYPVSLKRYVGDSNYGTAQGTAISKDGPATSPTVQHGRIMVLEQLRQQLAEDDRRPRKHGYIRKLAEWDDLDQEAQVEIALLTADSAPWAMDQEIHLEGWRRVERRAGPVRRHPAQDSRRPLRPRRSPDAPQGFLPSRLMRDQPQSALLRASRPIRRPPACGT